MDHSFFFSPSQKNNHFHTVQLVPSFIRPAEKSIIVRFFFSFLYGGKEHSGSFLCSGLNKGEKVQFFWCLLLLNSRGGRLHCLRWQAYWLRSYWGSLSWHCSAVVPSRAPQHASIMSFHGRHQEPWQQSWQRSLHLLYTFPLSAASAVPFLLSNCVLQSNGVLYLRWLHMDHPMGFSQGVSETHGADSITHNVWKRTQRREQFTLLPKYCDS